MYFLTDLILLLEYSFALVQKKSMNSFFLAEQKYKESGTSAQLSKELNAVLDKYSGTNSRRERVALIMNMISHHHMCK